MPIPFTLVLAGDLLTGRGVAAVLSQPQNTIWLYQPILAGADLTLGNLEAAPKSKLSGRKPFYHAGDLKILRDVGFDGFSLANNHTLDAGEIGARQTRTSLSQLGLKGAGLSIDQSNPIPIWNINGRRVAVVAATQWGPFSSGNARLTRLDTSVLKREIGDLNARGIFVIASLHWGTEGAATSSETQRQQARGLIDAGAIAVWGHHPHVAGPVETHKNRPIFYSTGNFLWDNMKTPQSGLLARLIIAGDDPQNAKISWKNWRVDGRAQALTAPPTPKNETLLGAYAGRFDADNARVSWMLWTNNAAKNPVLRALEPTSGGWRVRATGFPRAVARIETGDINGDGRDDVVVELRQRSKLDSQIKPRLHIYALDNDKFRPLWRGSMLSRPFTQWKLVGRADEPSDDVAALERGLNGQMWLTVYRWNSFGLRVVWQRAFEGELRDLRDGCDANGVFLKVRNGGKSWVARRVGTEGWQMKEGL